MSKATRNHLTVGDHDPWVVNDPWMAFRGWKAPKKQAADEGLAARVASLEAAVASLMSQNGHGKADIAKAMVEGVVSSAKSKSDMKTGL